MATSYPPILQPAMQRIAQLEVQVAELNMRLNAISKMLGMPDNGSETDYPTPSTPPTPPIISDPPIIVDSPITLDSPTSISCSFFCDSLTFVDEAPLFPTNHISDDSMGAAYSLEISGDNATFKLLDDESAFELLSGDISLYIESVAESDNEYDFDVIGVTTNEPGEAVRTDKGWKITKKAKISYKKEQ